LKAKATAADLASVLPLQECMEAQSASAGREGQEEGAAMPASCRHGDFSDSASTKFKLVCSDLWLDDPTGIIAYIWHQS
jgi:hypothetical protein